MNRDDTIAPGGSSCENATAYHPVGNAANGNLDTAPTIARNRALARVTTDGMASRLAHALLIVPQSHVRFDRTFQAEMYELFHRRPLARYGHLLVTPVINIALLAALTSVVPAAGLVGAAAIALWSLYVDRVAGVIMLPIIAAALAAHALAGLSPLAWLAIVWAGGFAQALSHASEPIPPPWTGSHRFVSLGPWLRSAPATHIVALALLSPTVFPLLEIWAAPRVWVLQVLHLMMRAGYRPALRDQLEVRVIEILDDARTGWAQPELR